MNRTIMASAFLLACLPTIPAHAQEQVWRVGDGYTIVTTDLDLASGSDRATLLRRVEFATTQLCRDVTPRQRRRECTGQAMAGALAAAAPGLRSAIATAQFERQSRRLAGR